MKMQETMVLTAAACMLVLGWRPVLGQEVQQVADRGDRAEHVEQRGGEAGSVRGAGRPALRGGQLSDEDVQEVMAFMREHSPNRFKAMEGLPEEGAARRGVLAFMAARYRALQAVKEEDPQLYDLNVKQVEIEDELYGLVAGAHGASDRDKLRDQIKAAVRRQVETNLAEREHRLNRLRESLRREERKAAEDRAQVDALTDSRTNTIVQEGVGALRRDVLRRGLREEARREGRAMGATSRPVEK